MYVCTIGLQFNVNKPKQVKMLVCHNYVFQLSTYPWVHQSFSIIIKRRINIKLRVSKEKY